MQFVLLTMLEPHQTNLVKDLKASRPVERMSGSSLRLVQHRNIFSKNKGERGSTNSSQSDRLKEEFIA